MSHIADRSPLCVLLMLLLLCFVFTRCVAMLFFVVPIFLIDDETENSHPAGMRSLQRFGVGQPITLREDAETANQMLRLWWIPAVGELGSILAV